MVAVDHLVPPEKLHHRIHHTVVVEDDDFLRGGLVAIPPLAPLVRREAILRLDLGTCVLAIEVLGALELLHRGFDLREPSQDVFQRLFDPLLLDGVQVAELGPNTVHPLDGQGQRGIRPQERHDVGQRNRRQVGTHQRPCAIEDPRVQVREPRGGLAVLLHEGLDVRLTPFQLGQLADQTAQSLVLRDEPVAQGREVLHVHARPVLLDDLVAHLPVTVVGSMVPAVFVVGRRVAVMKQLLPGGVVGKLSDVGTQRSDHFLQTRLANGDLVQDGLAVLEFRIGSAGVELCLQLLSARFPCDTRGPARRWSADRAVQPPRRARAGRDSGAGPPAGVPKPIPRRRTRPPSASDGTRVPLPAAPSLRADPWR